MSSQLPRRRHRRLRLRDLPHLGSLPGARLGSGANFGGLAVPAAGARALAAPSIPVAALLGSMPLVVAIESIVLLGIETQQRAPGTMMVEEPDAP